MIFPFGQTVQLVTRVKTGTDSLGNDVFSETPTSVPGAFIPGGSIELVQGQDVVTTQPSVLLPPGTVVAAVDVVIVGTDRYEVDGTPVAWDSPLTGWSPGVEVKLKKVTG